MKIRALMIEADEVRTEDVAEIVSRMFVRTEQAPPPIVAEIAPPAKLPYKPPPSHPWREGKHPAKRRGRKPRSEALVAGPRPEVSEHWQCSQCGEDRPPEKDGRSRCVKCGSHAWERVAAKHADLS